MTLTLLGPSWKLKFNLMLLSSLLTLYMLWSKEISPRLLSSLRRLLKFLFVLVLFASKVLLFRDKKFIPCSSIFCFSLLCYIGLFSLLSYISWKKFSIKSTTTYWQRKYLCIGFRVIYIRLNVFLHNVYNSYLHMYWKRSFQVPYFKKDISCAMLGCF